MPKRAPGSNATPRRAFLRGTAAAAAGIAFPNLFTRRVLAAEGATPANERLGLGFIGMGKQMGGHVGTYLGRHNCQVLAVCDVESRRLDQFQRRVNEFYAQKTGKADYAGCEAYKDYRELLLRPDIDAVIIASPEHWHALHVIDAANAGKDIYCEKPLSHTIQEARAMVNAVRQNAVVFQTGSQQRSDREFRIACELVRNGRIGQVHTVHVNVGGPPQACYLPAQPVPDGLDWDFWLGPAPMRPYNADIAPDIDYDGWPNWRSYRDYAGGMMTDWGAHHFDIAQWGLGMDDTGPVEIHPPDETYERLTYKYANGVVMQHGGGSGGDAGVEFVGELGRVMVNRGFLATDPEHLINELPGPGEIKLYDSDNHHDDWLRAIQTRSRPICDVEIGARTITVCHLGNIAYFLKRPLKWDPANERFVDDDEANRMLAKAMRSPWKLNV
ncbi:MAG TPA: Gfo/Idh/MocA family oxidoreductase [Candidatus Hydrogenedentes bacterium]|nr:Gfo/Idh/MocA family oxidoreductase [Candidatus Hydrogenedentota bacterium]HRK34214.1 Gfo/Idh/MocA family oxidoreductase [Candidatus Hydrogenedentota bacterium]